MDKTHHYLLSTIFIPTFTFKDSKCYNSAANFIDFLQRLFFYIVVRKLKISYVVVNKKIILYFSAVGEVVIEILWQ